MERKNRRRKACLRGSKRDFFVGEKAREGKGDENTDILAGGTERDPAVQNNNHGGETMECPASCAGYGRALPVVVRASGVIIAAGRAQSAAFCLRRGIKRRDSARMKEDFPRTGKCRDDANIRAEVFLMFLVTPQS